MSVRLRKGCPVCGRPGNGRPCRSHGQTRGDRRPYSDTAEYRRVKAEVLDTWGPVCVLYCGQPIDLELAAPDPRSLVLAHADVDHADGGPFNADNIRPAHRDCNAAAGRQPTGGHLG